MLDAPHLRRPAALLATLLFALSLGAPGVVAAQPKRDPAAADEAFRAAVPRWIPRLTPWRPQ